MAMHLLTQLPPLQPTERTNQKTNKRTNERASHGRPISLPGLGLPDDSRMALYSIWFGRVIPIWFHIPFKEICLILTIQLSCGKHKAHVARPSCQLIVLPKASFSPFVIVKVPPCGAEVVPLPSAFLGRGGQSSIHYLYVSSAILNKWKLITIETGYPTGSCDSKPIVMVVIPEPSL